jgi:outer membrane murein-binding lipoprotein Lpp
VSEDQEERVEELEETVRDLAAQVEALHTARRTLFDEVNDLEDENEELQARLDELEQRTNSALGVAKATRDGRDSSDGGPSKVDQTKWAARNEPVKRALIDSSGADGSGVTVGEVQTMLKPAVTAAYQTVKDAFDDLESEWPAFTAGKNGDGMRVLRVEKDALTEDLVGVVEFDLGRDDLTKRLISRREREGSR